MKKGTLVLVTWEDITASLHSEEDLLPAPAEAVGWVESDTKKYLRLITCRYLDDRKLADRICIPTGCVVKKEILCVKKPL